jgi:hypothetical protein
VERNISSPAAGQRHYVRDLCGSPVASWVVSWQRLALRISPGWPESKIGRPTRTWSVWAINGPVGRAGRICNLPQGEPSRVIPARLDPHASVTCPGLSQACVAGGRSGAQWPWGAWGMSPEKTAQPAEQARGSWPQGGPHSQRNSAGRTPRLATGTGCRRVDITTVRFRPVRSPSGHRGRRPVRVGRARVTKEPWG